MSDGLMLIKIEKKRAENLHRISKRFEKNEDSLKIDMKLGVIQDSIKAGDENTDTFWEIFNRYAISL